MSGKKELFDAINPSPRDDREKAIHKSITTTWSELGKGAIYGVKMYTAKEEARLRNPDFKGNPSDIDPRWVGTGPVTAMVTVAATGIGRGEDYKSLQSALEARTPGVAVDLVPWDFEPPKNHQIKGL